MFVFLLTACAKQAVAPTPQPVQPIGPPAVQEPTTPITPPVKQPPQAETKSVTISNFGFNPSTITIAKGTTVTWTNDDPMSHTVTADSADGGFSSKQLATGESFSYKFTKSGTFPYHCNIHKSMTATVIVQ